MKAPHVEFGQYILEAHGVVYCWTADTKRSCSGGERTDCRTVPGIPFEQHLGGNLSSDVHDCCMRTRRHFSQYLCEHGSE